MIRLVFLTLVIVTLSCKKEESELWTEVHVKATDYNTGEPLTDVYIGIIEWKDKLIADKKGEALSEGYTDANGEYNFAWKTKGRNNYSYEYVAQADPYKYKQIQFQQIDYLKKGNIHNYEIKLVEYGYLNMGYVNMNCENVNDEMRFRYYFKHPQHPQYIYIYIAPIGTENSLKTAV